MQIYKNILKRVKSFYYYLVYVWFSSQKNQVFLLFLAVSVFFL